MKNPRSNSDQIADYIHHANKQRKPGELHLAVSPNAFISGLNDSEESVKNHKDDMYINAHEAYDKFELFLFQKCPFRESSFGLRQEFQPAGKVSFFELICIARLRRLLVDKRSVFKAARNSLEHAITEKIRAEQRADEAEEMLRKVMKGMEELLKPLHEQAVKKEVDLRTKRQNIEGLVEPHINYLGKLLSKLSPEESELLILLTYEKSDENGAKKILSYADIGKKYNISKQAVYKNAKKLGEKYPDVGECVRSSRKGKKCIPVSALPPALRTQLGFGKEYNYNAG